jgi:hypothetical protein
MNKNNERRLMAFLNDHLAKVGKKYLSVFDAFGKEPERISEKTLLSIVKKNRNTEFGRKHHFEQIHSLSDYRKEVPVSDYEDYREAILRMQDGAKDVLFQGKPVYYTDTSGSTGKSKRIPISATQQKAMKKKGNPQIIPYLEKKNGCYDRNHRKILALMANADITYTKDHTPIGDVVSLMLSKVNGLMGLFFTTPLASLTSNEIHDRLYVHLLFALPETDIYLIMSAYLSETCGMVNYLFQNQELLLHDLAEGKISDCVKLSPALKRELEKKLVPHPERAKELKEILASGRDGILTRIWPSLTVVSGVGSTENRLRPYTLLVKRYLGSKGHIYYAAYNSSESLMGMATDYDTFLYAPVLDMAYLEFLPLDEKEQPIPGKILSVSELKDGAKYETVLTSLSGLYRYKMADIVKVSGRKGKLPLFEILGRNKILLDVMGEKCTFHQADDAIALLGEKIGEKEHPIYAYCAMEGNKENRYTFFLEIKGSSSLDQEKTSLLLKDCLALASPDIRYAFEEEGLLPPEVFFVQEGTFQKYLHNENREGEKTKHSIKEIKVLRTEDQKKFFKDHIEG